MPIKWTAARSSKVLRSRLLLAVIGGLFCQGVTAQEQLPPLRLLTSEKMPFNYRQESEINGLTVDLLKLMLSSEQLAGLELMPWPRALDTAVKQKNVLLFTMGKTAERQRQGFQFIGPVSRRYHILYAIDDSIPPVQSLADIKKHQLVVAGLRAGWLSDELQAAGIRMEQVGDYQQGMQMLAKGRAQLWLSTDLEEPVLQQLGNAGLQLKARWQMFCSENFIGLSPGSDPALARLLQQRFEQVVRSAAGQALANKWQQRIGQTLLLSPQYGFHLDNPALATCKPHVAP